ncbi:anti-sigma factor domain-containing protein [Nocardia sp. NRRL S-836]|uniref:anti-sigma factor n=1 Tax=Nocardia sp. NRRL S-836 TaxID=1519492 RepID=UPI0006AFD429|nr:anti-sigma factor [Nocardia sp. NRRL S-836]
MKPGRTRAINPHLLTGAHALGALPDAEEAEFEAHLGRCRSCCDEVAELRETVARLGMGVGHVVPRALRPRVLAGVRRVWQVPPVSEVGTALSRRRGVRRAAVVVAVACVVAGAVGGVQGVLSDSTIAPVVVPRTRVGDLLAAQDLRLVTTGGSAVTAAMSRSRNEMLFLANGLRTLPRGRVYQLWLVDGHGPRSAGTLRSDGVAASLLVAGIGEVGEALVTVEPAGGSPGPTSAPVVSIVLA